MPPGAVAGAWVLANGVAQRKILKAKLSVSVGISAMYTSSLKYSFCEILMQKDACTIMLSMFTFHVCRLNINMPASFYKSGYLISTWPAQKQSPVK